jgi:hypothetical protein
VDEFFPRLCVSAFNFLFAYAAKHPKGASLNAPLRSRYGPVKTTAVIRHFP